MESGNLKFLQNSVLKYQNLVKTGTINLLIIYNMYIISTSVLARIAKVAVQNKFVGVVTWFGRGQVLLGVATILLLL